MVLCTWLDRVSAGKCNQLWHVCDSMSICTHHIDNYPNAHIIISLLPLLIAMCYFTDELIVNIAVSITDADLLLGWYVSDFFSGDILILQHQLTSVCNRDCARPYDHNI